MKPYSFEADSGAVYPEDRFLDLKSLAKQECEAYLKKREAGRLDAYEKIKEALKKGGNTWGTLQFPVSRDNLIQIMEECLIERDKPEGEDE